MQRDVCRAGLIEYIARTRQRFLSFIQIRGLWQTGATHGAKAFGAWPSGLPVAAADAIALQTYLHRMACLEQELHRLEQQLAEEDAGFSGPWDPSRRWQGLECPLDVEDSVRIREWQWEVHARRRLPPRMRPVPPASSRFVAAAHLDDGSARRDPFRRECFGYQ